VTRKLNEKLTALLRTDTIMRTLKDLGSVATPGPPEALTRRLKADYELTRKQGKGLKLEP
jgi:hypothetical protein